MNFVTSSVGQDVGRAAAVYRPKRGPGRRTMLTFLLNPVVLVLVVVLMLAEWYFDGPGRRHD